MINLIQGNSADFDVTVALDDAAYNLTTHKIWFTIKDSVDDNDEEALLQITTLSGIAITDAPNGHLRISLTPEQTEALPTLAILPCDVQIRSPEGKVYTIMIDELYVTKRVTKAIDYVA